MSGESGVPTTVEQLMDLERRIDAEAEAVAQLAGSQPALASVAEKLRATSAEHRKALEEARGRVSKVSPPLADLRLANALLPLYSSLNASVVAYAALHALAHRAFDSSGEGNTAGLAESHLRAHAQAIQEIDVLVSDAAVLESSERGVECQCTCPACSLGLCLCAPHGAITLRQVWQDTLPSAAQGGLRVRRPRTGSEAERADIRAGDRITAIDGAAIASDLDASGVQTAIRAHSSGEEIRLTVQSNEGAARDVRVRRP